MLQGFNVAVDDAGDQVVYTNSIPDTLLARSDYKRNNSDADFHLVSMERIVCEWGAPVNEYMHKEWGIS